MPCRKGRDYQEDTQKLEKAGSAKSFKWQAVWREQLDGELQLDPSFWRDPATGNSHVWLNFEIRPAP